MSNEYASAQVFTQDERDPSIAAKPFPDKPYIGSMVQDWLTYKMNLWDKSRQVMASSLYLHDTQFTQRTVVAAELHPVHHKRCDPWEPIYPNIGY